MDDDDEEEEEEDDDDDDDISYDELVQSMSGGVEVSIKSHYIESISQSLGQLRPIRPPVPSTIRKYISKGAV